MAWLLILLISVRDANGFALGVVEPIHDLDVDDHAESAAENEQQHDCDQDSRPDGHGEEGDAVVCVTETLLISSRGQRFNLKTTYRYDKTIQTH